MYNTASPANGGGSLGAGTQPYRANDNTMELPHSDDGRTKDETFQLDLCGIIHNVFRTRTGMHTNIIK